MATATRCAALATLALLTFGAEVSGLRLAGAIVAGFGVSNMALLDELAGTARQRGRLPFALANNLRAVVDNQPDTPRLLGQ